MSDGLDQSPAGGQPSLRGRVLRGGVASALGIVAIAGSVVAVNAMLARLLSPSEFGSYALTATFVTIAATVARLGLPNAMIRCVAGAAGVGDFATGRAAITHALAMTLGSAILVAAALWLGLGRWFAQAILGSPELGSVMVLAPLWLIVVAVQFVIAEAFRGLHRIGFAALLSPPATNLFALPIFALLLGTGSSVELRGVVLVLIAAHALVCVGGALLLRRRVGEHARGGRLGAAELMSIAWPMWITSIATILRARGDQWILGGLSDEVATVAVYAAAAQLATIADIPLRIANGVVTPLIAELHAQDRRTTLQQIVRAFAGVATLPVALLAILFAVFGRDLLGVLYGSYYGGGVDILLILTAGYLANSAFGSCSLLLMMTSHQTSVMWVAIAAGVLTIVGGLAGGALWGGAGIATAVTAALIFQNVSNWLVARKKLGIWSHAGLPHHDVLRQSS